MGVSVEIFNYYLHVIVSMHMGLWLDGVRHRLAQIEMSSMLIGLYWHIVNADWSEYL